MWDALHLCMHWLLPCRKRVGRGLCGAVAGLFGGGGGVGAGLRRRGQTQGVLTWGGAAAAAAGGRGSARRRGGRRRVTGHAPTAVLQPVRRQLYFVWEKTQQGRGTDPWKSDLFSWQHSSKVTNWTEAGSKNPVTLAWCCCESRMFNISQFSFLSN